MLYAGIFLGGRAVLDEQRPQTLAESPASTAEPTQVILEAVLDATPEPSPTATTQPALESTATPTETANEQASSAEAPASPTETPPTRVETTPERTMRPSPAVARNVSTPARIPAVASTADPKQPGDLYSVSSRVCGSGVARYPIGSAEGIIYGACTSGVSTVSTLPTLTCPSGHVLMPSVQRPGSIYCYATGTR